MHVSNQKGLRRSAIWIPLLLVTALALALRMPYALAEDVAHRDGLQYVAIARAIHAGDWQGATAHRFPPGYPLLVASVAAALGGRPGEQPQARGSQTHFSLRDATSDGPYLLGARVVSALLGAITVVPVFLVAVWLGGGVLAGVFAGILLALQPYHVLYSHAVLTEAAFCLLMAASLALAVYALSGEHPVRHAAGLSGSSCVAGLAYLIRPEGLTALLAVSIVAVRLRPRPATIASLILPALLVASPYLLELNRGVDTASTISRKRDPGTMVSAVADQPCDYAANVAGNVAAVVEFGHPVLFALAVLGLALVLRAPRGRATRAALVLGIGALAHLAVTSEVRVDRRFALVISVMILPLGALGAAFLTRRLARIPSCRGNRAALMIGSLVALTMVPVLLHKNRPLKPAYLVAARHIRAEAARLMVPRPSVFTRDERIAYYADAEAVCPAAGETWLAALARSAADGRVDLVALTDRDDASSWVAALQELEPPRGFELLAAVPTPSRDRGGGVRLYRIVRE
ncbi:phospholipid carrier-dependent glycosyltransferase [Planctomycetota bacterium]